MIYGENKKVGNAVDKLNFIHSSLASNGTLTAHDDGLVEIAE
jgi:hypothetical protein